MPEIAIGGQRPAGLAINGQRAGGLAHAGRLIYRAPALALPAGMAGWWRASDLTAADGERIRFWPDASGLGRDMHSNGSAAGGQYLANHAGHPAVYLGGDATYTLAIPSLSASINERTVFAVLNPRQSTQNHNLLDGSASGGYSLRQTGGGVQVVVRAVKAGPTSATSALAAGRTSVITARWDGATVTYWADGLSAGGGAFTTPTTPDTYQLVGGGTSYMDGRLYELIIYDRALTEPEITKAHTYLTTRYATT